MPMHLILKQKNEFIHIKHYLNKYRYLLSSTKKQGIFPLISTFIHKFFQSFFKITTINYVNNFPIRIKYTIIKTFFFFY